MIAEVHQTHARTQLGTGLGVGLWTGLSYAWDEGHVAQSTANLWL